MKFKLPLHIKILIAILLGIIFGGIFAVDNSIIIFEYQKGENYFISEYKNPSKIIFLQNNDTLKTFTKGKSQLAIKYYNSLENKNYISAIVNNDLLESIKKVKKDKSIISYIKPIGTIFIKLLSFIAIPLVISSLIVGASGLGDIKKLGRIGFRTFFFYITTTAIAIVIGLGLANLIKPGEFVDESNKSFLMESFSEESSVNLSKSIDIDLVDFFVNIVPKNPFDSISSGNMLQIVFFAVMFGLTLTFVEKKHSQPVIEFFDGVSNVMIKMVDIIMKLAPYGVFVLIASVISDFGLNIVLTLFWYSVTVVLGLFLHTFGFYALMLKSFTKMKLSKFFGGIRNAQAIAFSTSSSAATLPITFDCVENNLGVKKEISGFVLPLGATINMDGTALYQGVAAVFIAQVFNIDLSLTDQLTIIITAVLASIGTAPVPGVGLIMLILILDSVGIPKEGIALIIGVDRVLDMLRTVTNVTGDALVAVVVDSMEKK